MSAIVLDASVLIKLYINEVGSRRAINAVKNAESLLAPDLLWSETGNILWKYVRRGELNADDAQGMLADMLQMPIDIIRSEVLLPEAFKIAAQTERTVYDAMYVALAMQSNTVMLTADERLVNALKQTDMGKWVRTL